MMELIASCVRFGFRKVNFSITLPSLTVWPMTVPSARMRLDEIRSSCLIYDGTDITGNEHSPMQQRHTKFYRLDIDSIRLLGDCNHKYWKQGKALYTASASTGSTVEQFPANGLPRNIL